MPEQELIQEITNQQKSLTLLIGDLSTQDILDSHVELVSEELISYEQEEAA